jgi:hypothetical protein
MYDLLVPQETGRAARVGGPSPEIHPEGVGRIGQHHGYCNPWLED